MRRPTDTDTEPSLEAAVGGPRLTVMKTYRDLPCSHRAWRHEGHCRFVHGYSRSYTFHFAAREPDACGFVVDFSSLKPLKAWLEHMFDHTTLINEDDPELPLFRELHARGILDLRVVEHCGMEGSARLCWEVADALVRASTDGRAWCYAVEARENQKNAVIFQVPADGSVASTREANAGFVSTSEPDTGFVSTTETTG